MFNGKEWALKVESPAAGGDQADVESGGVGHHAGQDQLRQVLLTTAQFNRPEHNNSVHTYGSRSNCKAKQSKAKRAIDLDKNISLLFN